MRTGFILLLLQFCLLGFAQERCATTSYINEKQAGFSAEAKAIRDAEAFLQKKQAFKTAAEEPVIRIPVVVHVVYNNASQNISDAQIKSGLQALNRDFRRQNFDTVNTPAVFRHLAADVQIEFALATADPSGRSTTGIERRQTNRLAWLADDKVKQGAQGGINVWDSRSYLNIWICNLSAGSGYATLPGSAAEKDGVVIHYNAFGTINTAEPFNLGRTAVHEVGHWLGLKHIWGDTQCGDDGVADTPKQGFFTQGCPSGVRSSCNNEATGDMYMNYMDYTNDACMNLFTKGQRQRMRAAFSEGGPRASLLKSKGLNEPWMQESPLMVSTATGLYPNPAKDKVTLQADATKVGTLVQLFTIQGQLIRTEKITSTQQGISLQMLKPGFYLLKGEGFLYKFVKS